MMKNLEPKYNLSLYVKSFLISLMTTALVIIYNVMCIEINIISDNQIIMQCIYQITTFPMNMVYLLVFVCFFIISLLCMKNSKVVSQFVYKWRWAIATGLLIVLVSLNLNGSSIGAFSSYLPNATDQGFVTGVTRYLRTDEWAVNTPMAFSQFFNSSGAFPYFGNVFRGTSTDMFIVYGQPVLNIAVLFRPFHWGYLILGLERGLAFFWWARLIALFMVSFELGMLITKGKKPLSLAYAMLVALSPIVQWWFAINGLVEMLVFGQLAVIIIYNYMITKSYKVRALLMVALSLCGGGYILTFYPSWQVPLAYVFLALIIWAIVENKNKYKFRAKIDIPILMISLVVLGAGMAYIFSKSYDTVMAVLNTSYPGARVECGGGSLSKIFSYPFTLAYPLTDANIVTNVCEAAVFFDFFPLGIILSFYVIFKEKKKDSLLISTLIFGAALYCYCIIGLPEIISKLSLLSFSQSDRAILAIGFVNIILLVRSIALINKKATRTFSIVASAVFTIAVILLSISPLSLENNYFQMWMLVPIILALVLGVYFMLRKDYNSFAIICAGIVFLSGVMVNPIRQGADVIYDNELVQSIDQINNQQEGIWIVDSMESPLINVPTLVGASTINSTNVYPNLELWEQFDEDGNYNEIYNRYAHITIDLTNETQTTFEITSLDSFTVDMNVDELYKTNASYVMTDRNIEQFDTNNTEFTLIDSVENIKIYQINYK